MDKSVKTILKKRLIYFKWKFSERKNTSIERTREFDNWLKAAKFGSITAIIIFQMSHQNQSNIDDHP